MAWTTAVEAAAAPSTPNTTRHNNYCRGTTRTTSRMHICGITGTTMTFMLTMYVPLKLKIIPINIQLDVNSI